MQSLIIPPTIIGNVFIGGVGQAGITAADIAAKTSLAEVDVLDFVNDGLNVRFSVAKNYSINSLAWQGVTTMTYYIDLSGYLINVGSKAFQGISTFVNPIKVFISRGIATQFLNVDHFEIDTGAGANILELFSSPQTLWLGGNSFEVDTQNNNTVWRRNNGNLRAYVNTYLATNNAGSPDSDLTANPPGQGIVYCSDFTQPNFPNNLAASNIASNSFDLTWSIPSSSNPIDRYIVFLDMDFYKIVATNSASITGLIPSTSYSVRVMAIDDNGNASEFSNELSVVTLA